MSSAAPVVLHRGRERDHARRSAPPSSTRSRGRPARCVSTPSRTSAHRGQQPGHGRRASGRSRARATIARERRPAPAARPRPSGTAWRRTASGGSTTSTSRSSRCSSSAAHVPSQQQHVAGGERELAGPSVLALRAGRRGPRDRRSAVTMPGKNDSPTSGERGGTTTSATPERRVNERSGTSCARRRVERVLVASSVRAWPLRSAGSDRARPRSGSSRSPSSSDDRDRPERRAARRRARTRRSRSARRRRPRPRRRRAR